MTYITLEPVEKDLKVVRGFDVFNWNGFTPSTVNYYKIISVGNTDWTSWGVSSASVGDIFKPSTNSSGSGTGTVVNAFQETTTTNTILEGSVINYTPASGSNKVVYEFNSVYGYLGAKNGFQVKLQYGSDIDNLADIDSNNYVCSIGQTNNTTGYYGADFLQVRFLINAWSGSKTLALLVKSFDTNADRAALINASTPTANELTESLLYDPFIVCYSI